MYYNTFQDDVSLHGGVPKMYSSMKNKVFKDWEIAPWELRIYKDRKLGEGSWAEVYLAKWKETYVVAKVMKPTPKNYLYLREFDNMTKMHHPNIVQLFGYVEDPFIIVMEYFPNKDLSSNQNLNKKQKIAIACDILKGLNYMHTRKPDTLIHRDIKPSNIMLTNSRIAKIVDFGLSKLSETNHFVSSHDKELNLLDNESGHTSYVGSLRYMAPEVENTHYTTKIDIYSTGILLYELFEGKLHLRDTPLRFFWTPKKFKELIAQMTNKNPDCRPTAKECLIYFN